MGTDDTTSDPHEIAGGADVEEQQADAVSADAVQADAVQAETVQAETVQAETAEPEPAGNPGWHLPRELVVPGVIALACIVLAAVVSVIAFTSHGGTKPSPVVAAASGGRSGGVVAQGRGRANGGGAQPVGGIQPAKAAGVSVTSDGISKAALPLPPRHRHAVARWNAGPGGAALAAVTSQLGAVSQIGGAGLFATMKQGCATLGSDIAGAQAAAPIPDAAMQRAYSHSLTRLATAVATCRSAITAWPEGDEDIQTHENKPLLRTSVAEMSAGAKQLYLATAQIRMLHT